MCASMQADPTGDRRELFTQTHQDGGAGRPSELCKDRRRDSPAERFSVRLEHISFSPASTKAPSGQDNIVLKGGERKIISQPRILYVMNFSSCVKEKFRPFQVNKSSGNPLLVDLLYKKY